MEVDDNEIMRIVNNLKNKSSYGYDCIIQSITETC